MFRREGVGGGAGLLARVRTKHRLGNGEGDGGAPGHPPPGRQVGDFRPQHLHDHLVVQRHVELLVVDELRREGEHGVPDDVELGGPQHADPPVGPPRQAQLRVPACGRRGGGNKNV